MDRLVFQAEKLMVRYLTVYWLWAEKPKNETLPLALKKQQHFLPGNDVWTHQDFPQEVSFSAVGCFTLDGMKWLISGSVTPTLFTRVPSWSVSKGPVEVTKGQRAPQSVCGDMCVCVFVSRLLFTWSSASHWPLHTSVVLKPRRSWPCDWLWW